MELHEKCTRGPHAAFRCKFVVIPCLAVKNELENFDENILARVVAEKI